ncbi:unnamed protein product, partial [Allacma fusca]
ADLELRY